MGDIRESRKAERRSEVESGAMLLLGIVFIFLCIMTGGLVIPVGIAAGVIRMLSKGIGNTVS